MTLGEQIRKHRKRLGVTLLEVANYAGVTESHMSLIENDKRDPSLRVLREIAAALGVTASVTLRKAQ